MPDLDDPVSDLIRGLDRNQWAAVTSPAPLLAVIAGAGSGKTGVLTRRVAYRCLTGSADVDHVAVLTFTRQAASELRRRLYSLGLRDRVNAGTFHSVALSLLRQHWDDTGRAHPTVVSDRRRLIGEVLGKKHSGTLFDLAADIDWARARDVTATDYARACASVGRRSAAPPAEVARVLADLEDLKRRRGVVDLDDLLSITIHLMRDNKLFASSVRWRLRHLFVDEAQDLNPLQSAVLDHWRAGRDDLTLVGDPAQSIYGFNGADPTNLLELERRFPGVEVVRLDTNYRCTPQIVGAGLAVLSHLDSEPPPLVSARSDGATVSSISFRDERAECEGVARLVREARTPAGTYRSIAVLARTNAQLAPLLEALRAVDVPARIVGSVAADPVQRAVREVGELGSATRIAMWARDTRFETDPGSDPGPVSERPEAPDGRADIDQSVRRARLVVADAVDEFLATSGGDGRAFLAWVRANRPFEEEVVDSGSVELLTFHTAKGREWSTVIVTGCERGLMPHSSARSPLESDEEVRLAYVAFTRAADRLILTRAESRRGRGRTPSPFLTGVGTDVPRSEPSAAFVDGQIARRRAATDAVTADPDHSRVLQSLREWRRRSATRAGVDPSFICPDRVLEIIAASRPTTIEELGAISEVGTLFAERVGSRVLAAVAEGLTP